MKTISFVLSIIASLHISAYLLPAVHAQEILCEGDYGGHLQGIVNDEDKFIYWSFTVDLVKTDFTGKILKHISVPTHHGDLTIHKGKIYVAVNLGEFNEEPGKAYSWIYVYKAADLSLLSTHEIPELVHGAGGMAYHAGSFIVVGGLPKGYKENYAYEYDGNLRFIKRHIIQSGYTLMGIQTAGYAFGYWWFGCYGKPNNKPLLKTDKSFRMRGAYDTDFSIGITALPDGKLLKGESPRLKGKNRWQGKAVYIESKQFPNQE